MAKTTLVLLLFFSSICFCSGQYTKNYLDGNDLSSALNLMGMNIYKYAIASKDTVKFNLLYQEFSNGRCVDSSRLVSEKEIDQIRLILNQWLVITKDTNFLRIFVQKNADSVYHFTSSYSFFGAIQKEVTIPFKKFGTHELREFASPKITRKGYYPILLLSGSWKQTISGQTIQRFCFPEDIESIKLMIPHFYVFSVVAY